MNEDKRSEESKAEAKPHPYKLPGRSRGMIWRHRTTFIVLLVLLALVVLALIGAPF